MNETPRRRTVKRFEPPPWERVYFEELQRDKQEAQKPSEPARVAGPKDAELLERQPATEEPLSQSEHKTHPEDPRIEVMLMQLSAEEPSPSEALWKVGLLTGIFLTSLGGMLIVWGAIGLVRTSGSGIAGVTGGSILIGLGVIFVGLAGWIMMRSLKQRGAR